MVAGSHYDIQKTRRREALASWISGYKTVVRREDLEFEEVPSRRMRTASFAGRDSARRAMELDASVHEIDPGVGTTVHRHAWDAICFIEAGTGTTEVDGRVVSWRPWDTVYLPQWSWHRHTNSGDRPARLISWSLEPLYEQVGVAAIDDGGDTPFQELPPRRLNEIPAGDDRNLRRRRRLQELALGSMHSRVITHFEDVRGVVSKRGARSLFLVDRELDYTGGDHALTAVMHELAPGAYQAGHRHGGEAYLYVVSGRGHSEFEDGATETWKAGDLVVVDHWTWHKHFNDDPTETARLVRVHSGDAVSTMMRVLLYPMKLEEELPELDAPDLSGVVWPDHLKGRPEV